MSGTEQICELFMFFKNKTTEFLTLSIIAICIAGLCYWLFSHIDYNQSPKNYQTVVKVYSGYSNTVIQEYRLSPTGMAYSHKHDLGCVIKDPVLGTFDIILPVKIEFQKTN